MGIEVHNHYIKRKLIIFIIILIFAFLFWSSSEIQNFFSNFYLLSIQFIENHKLLGIIVFLVISALSAILSPFSSIPLIPITAAIWGNTITIAMLLIGWLGGGITSYYLGSLTGYSLAKKIFSPQKAEYYKNGVSAQTNFLTVLIFRLAMPTEIAGYILGTIKYNFTKYLIATTLAETPFAFISVYSSEALLEVNKNKFIFFIFLTIALIGAMLYFFKKINKKDI